MPVESSMALEELLEGILDEKLSSLSDEEMGLLEKNGEAVAEKLLPLVAEEVMHLLKGNEPNSPAHLYWGLSILSFLKEARVFEWVKKLCRVETELVDEYLGHAFVPETLPYVLAATCEGRWEELKAEIEDASLDEFIRSACIEALSILVSYQEVKREEIIDYFQEIFHAILYHDLDDEPLATHLVNTCVDLWPGECIEEIRELFGLRLIDTSLIEIEDVLKGFSKGKERCLEDLSERVFGHYFLQPLSQDSLQHEQLEPHDLAKLSHETDQAYRSVQSLLAEPLVNESLADQLFEEGRILFEPYANFEGLPVEEEEAVKQLFGMTLSSPEQALIKTREMIDKYPEAPLLYSHLYLIYCELDWKREAIQLMKELVEKFPDYLFGLVEYARYFLRRGEPEKIPEIFGGAFMLQEFYPAKEKFPAAEWLAFAHVIALYQIEIGEYRLAKNYLELLERIDPECEEVLDIREMLEMRAFFKALKEPLSPQ
jgi:tetratricopeptide (TPR) repeat protein